MGQAEGGGQQSRLAAAPQPPQRYGLSVVLRKGYPAVGSEQWAASRRDHGLRVEGADVEHVGWDDLPRDVLELVRRRALEDPYVAAYVLAAPSVPTVDIRESGELALDSSLSSALVLRVGSGVTFTVREFSKSAFRAESGSAAVGEGTALRSQGLRSALCILVLESGATVRWFGASVGLPGIALMERLAVLRQDAALHYHSALVGAETVREEVRTVLTEPGATVSVHTLFVGSAAHQFDLGVTAEHRAPHTASDLRAKGVLSGRAQGVYRGLVRMTKDATASDGYQRCDALLLSKTAEVDPIPTLEIETNDVRCTHGVTVSHVNPEHLFYLQSRGLSSVAAQDLLVEGFAGSMLRSYDERSRDALRSAVQQTLKGTP